MATTDAARLALYQTAEEEILASGQSLAIAGRALSRADLKWIAEMISTLQTRVDNVNRGPIRLGNARVSS